MNVELKKIIDKSYQIFSNYSVGETLDVCTECCVTKKEELELTRTNVKDIPFELLYTYHTAGKPQNLNTTEFKHFVPRYLDLTANLKFVSHSVEIVLTTIGEIKEWTTEETELLKSFGKEFFKHCLNTYPFPEDGIISSILIMLAKGDFNVEQYLKDWENFESFESVLHFGDLINYGFNHKKPEKLCSGFSEERTNKLVFEWVNDSNTKTIFKERIETLILNPVRILEKNQTELSWAYDRLSQ